VLASKPLLAQKSLSVEGRDPMMAQIDESKPPLEELIITGTREPVAKNLLGASVSVIDGARIEARQVPLLSDLLRDVPGVSVSPTGPLGSQTQIRIRGAEGNQTLVLIDGIEATDPVGNFELDFADVLTTGIERIEVIKGAQSALYGSEAIGGVISILTKEPVEGFEVEALAEGGSFGTARLGTTLAGGTKRLGATVSVGYLNTDGVSASPTGDERDGYENLTLSAKIKAQPTDQLRLGLVLRRVSANSEFDQQDFATGQIVDADLDRSFDAFYGQADARLDLFDERWRQRIWVAFTDTDSDNFAQSQFTNSFEGQRLKFGYQSSFALPSTDVTLAVEHEELDFKSINADLDDPSNQDQKDDQSSFIGEMRSDVWPGLYFTLGVRHDLNGDFKDATTWRSTASWQLPAAIRLHGSFGTGVSDPTFFDRFGFFPGQFIGNENLSPEKAKGWDLGLEKTWLDETLVFDLTWFSSTLRDEIVSVFDATSFLSSVENQIGKSDRRGVELSLLYQPHDNLEIFGSYTWLDAEEPDQSREVRRARHQASLSGTWRFLSQRGSLTASVHYTGDQDDLDFSSFPAQRVVLDDFVLMTVAARYRLFDGVDAVARLENALDQSFQTVLGFNTPGLGAFAGIRAAF
jgi:vitamin B12 transporter